LLELYPQHYRTPQQVNGVRSQTPRPALIVSWFSQPEISFFTCCTHFGNSQNAPELASDAHHETILATRLHHSRCTPLWTSCTRLKSKHLQICFFYWPKK